jgi:hypothetical protein
MRTAGIQTGNFGRAAISIQVAATYISSWSVG